MAYGVTPEGFKLKTLADIKNEKEAALKSSLGASINLSENSILGQLVGVNSESESDLWEQLQSVYNSFVPELSGGVSQDNISSINNIVRLRALPSTVTATITGTALTNVSSGFQVSVQGNSSSVFQTLEDTQIEAGGTVDVLMEAIETGPTIALAGTLTEIVTPAGGVDSVSNALDADIGRNVETDNEFYLRRLDLLNKSGTATIEGIRKAILSVDDVEQATVIENDTFATDSDGRPPKCFEAFVLGGINTDIANVIFDSKAGGIQAYGAISEVVTDSQGINHTIGFSRPVELEIYLIVNITPNTNPSEGAIYPVDGDNQVENAIIEFVGNEYKIGQDVIVNQLYTPINTISGVIGIEILIGIAPNPTLSDNISVSNTEIATFDSSRITINS
jgi:uncharacterized phage protein gp47/JayE